jgi:hypothetical protein
VKFTVKQRAFSNYFEQKKQCVLHDISPDYIILFARL